MELEYNEYASTPLDLELKYNHLFIHCVILQIRSEELCKKSWSGEYKYRTDLPVRKICAPARVGKLRRYINRLNNFTCELW